MNKLKIVVKPVTYLKYDFIVICIGYMVLINGKKYPKKRGHIYQSYNNNKETVKKLAIKEFKNC
jgi:hypothetical protein|tara:strand:+ start:837 stop:1028 length:192 start_codon:yes stop_codon:yes gene_type:complete